MYVKDQYDKQYHKENVYRKVLNFNRRNQDDMEIMEHLMKQGNYSQYIKALIRADMEKEATK